MSQIDSSNPFAMMNRIFRCALGFIRSGAAGVRQALLLQKRMEPGMMKNAMESADDYF
jgi:hypothetical protein